MSEDITNLPRIRFSTLQDSYSHLWLKYVTGVDLSQHCARSLKGKYSEKLQHKKGNFDIILDEHRAETFYLCGVTTPYDRERNVHLAMRLSPGAYTKLKIQGISAELFNVEEYPFNIKDINRTDPNSFLEEFSTCRNWQFANRLAIDLALHRPKNYSELEL
jgi:hypothetical protein